MIVTDHRHLVRAPGVHGQTEEDEEAGELHVELQPPIDSADDHQYDDYDGDESKIN